MRASKSHKSHPSLIQKITPVSLILVSCSLLMSCGNYSPSTLARKSVKSVKSVTKLIPSRRVPIATVRVKDLRKMPTGADRALAWNRHLDSKRYAFFTPKRYRAPKLPSARSLPSDSGILPPLHPGSSSSMEARGELPPE